MIGHAKCRETLREEISTPYSSLTAFNVIRLLKTLPGREVEVCLKTPAN